MCVGCIVGSTLSQAITLIELRCALTIVYTYSVTVSYNFLHIHARAQNCEIRNKLLNYWFPKQLMVIGVPFQFILLLAVFLIPFLEVFG